MFATKSRKKAHSWCWYGRRLARFAQDVAKDRKMRSLRPFSHDEQMV